MRVYPVRRSPSRYQSPFILYFRGISRAFLLTVILSLLALGYIYTVSQQVFYFSWVMIGLVGLSVLMGGLASGKDDKGWFYGGLVGATYGLMILGVNYYIIPGTFQVLTDLKYFFILCILGSLGGSAGYHITLTKARYTINRQRGPLVGKGRLF